MDNFENKLIEVCSECQTASCWHGEFMCLESKNAGTVKKTVSELRILNLESSGNWSNEKLNDVYGEYAPHGHRHIEPKTTFKELALGAKFKYPGLDAVWVKVSPTTVAEWVEELKDCGWMAQTVASFDENDNISLPVIVQ